MPDKFRHLVAVVGGACAGSTVAGALAERGCEVVVFEQNPRPYGKIEDGLPCWHDKQRLAEYAKIDERLDHARIHFVPNTRLGRDLDFLELAAEWGWSAVVLANGAWKDRPLDIPGADAAGPGLLYQNALISWFNHRFEAGYDGPVYEIPDGTLVVGGGLASIDCVKIVQIELYRTALLALGIRVGLNELERQGIPKVCEAHGVDPAALGVRGGTLLYRRGVAEMPLATAPADAPQRVVDRLPETRARILEKARDKFLFHFLPQRLPVALQLQDGRVTGLVAQGTEVVGGSVRAVQGSELVLPTPMVISSIGSIPEPIEGIEMEGVYYRFRDRDTGEYAPLPGVFATGNVITGQGNIKVSREHGRYVGEHLALRYLGLDGDGERALAEGTDRASANAGRTISAVARHLSTATVLTPNARGLILERVRVLQERAGYGGDYAAWIRSHTPEGQT